MAVAPFGDDLVEHHAERLRARGGRDDGARAQGRGWVWGWAVAPSGDDLFEPHAGRLRARGGRDDGARAGLQRLGEPARLGPCRAHHHVSVREHVADLVEPLEREPRPAHLVEQDQVGGAASEAGADAGVAVAVAHDVHAGDRREAARHRLQGGAAVGDQGDGDHEEAPDDETNRPLVASRCSRSERSTSWTDSRSAEARALMKEATSWKPSLSASYSKTGRRALKSSLALRMLSRFCSVVSQGCALRSSASRWVVLGRRVSDTRTTVPAPASRWKVDFLCRVGGLPDPWLGQVESPSGGGAHPPAGDPLDEWSGERNPLDTVRSSLHCSCL